MSDIPKIRDTIRKRKPTADRLQAYIQRCTGRMIPSRCVCKNHTAPLDFVKEFMYGDSDILVLANRSGGKTATSGMATGLVAYHDKVSSKLLGGSGEQSLRMYEETKWFLEQGYEDRLADEILKTEVSFKSGNKISIMTQSMKSVRGPHVPLVIYDEIDEFEEDVFEAGKSIPKTDSITGFPSKMVMQSTRHYAGGLMSKEWQKDDPDRKKFVWCIWEIIEPCDERYNCTTCALTSAGCPGKEALAMSDGYFSVRDTIKMYKRLSADAWHSEWLCDAPRKAGMVYNEFSKELCGKKRWVWDLRIPIWRACDYGIDNHTVVQYWQVDPSGRGWCFHEKRWTGTAPSVIAKEMVAEENKRGWKKFDGTIVDPTAAGFRKELENIGKTLPKERGLKTCILAINDRDPGITRVRDLLVPREDGLPAIMIDPVNCKPTIEEMEGWRMRNGVPVKEKDHGCFVAGTLVRTNKGEVPIEEISVGDIVCTSYGEQKVLDAQMTRRNADIWRLLLSDGTDLLGTEDHKIWTHCGVAPLSSLQKGDRTQIWKPCRTTLVELVEDTGQKQDVYNITVDYTHNYFANGILVSNCDALRYFCMTCPLMGGRMRKLGLLNLGNIY